MTKIRIPAMDIARRHPLFLKGTTDAAYARFASDLAELMERTILAMRSCEDRVNKEMEELEF